MAVMGLSPAVRVDAGGTEGLTLGVQVLQSTSLGAAAPESTLAAEGPSKGIPLHALGLLILLLISLSSLP